jgi:hypothetical protein
MQFLKKFLREKYQQTNIWHLILREHKFLVTETEKAYGVYFVSIISTGWSSGYVIYTVEPLITDTLINEHLQ